MYHMVEAVRDEMQSAYPELVDSADRVSRVVGAEELAVRARCQALDWRDGE